MYNELKLAVLKVVHLVLHIDQYLVQMSNSLGSGMYWLLFAIIFAETGLVITPFLPGDSLLFAAGAISSMPAAELNLWVLMGVLIVAAVLGDFVNYNVGKFASPKVFLEGNRFFKKSHLEKTQKFYAKYGGKTIILARFIPIVRTFAPFVAGVGMMPYGTFVFYNIIGALCWVVSFTSAGYYFGNLPQVKSNFHYIILAIIVLSILPAIIEIIREKAKGRNS